MPLNTAVVTTSAAMSAVQNNPEMLAAITQAVMNIVIKEAQAVIAQATIDR
jgi:hypothetical protein